MAAAMAQGGVGIHREIPVPGVGRQSGPVGWRGALAGPFNQTGRPIRRTFRCNTRFQARVASGAGCCRSCCSRSCHRACASRASSSASARQRAQKFSWRQGRGLPWARSSAARSARSRPAAPSLLRRAALRAAAHAARAIWAKSPVLMNGAPAFELRDRGLPMSASSAGGLPIEVHSLGGPRERLEVGVARRVPVQEGGERLAREHPGARAWMSAWMLPAAAPIPGKDRRKARRQPCGALDGERSAAGAAGTGGAGSACAVGIGGAEATGHAASVGVGGCASLASECRARAVGSVGDRSPDCRRRARPAVGRQLLRPAGPGAPRPGARGAPGLRADTSRRGTPTPRRSAAARLHAPPKCAGCE